MTMCQIHLANTFLFCNSNRVVAELRDEFRSVYFKIND